MKSPNRIVIAICVSGLVLLVLKSVHSQQWFIRRQPARGCLNRRGREFKALSTLDTKLAGQHGETQVIHDNFFAGCHSGTYLEIGGKDGLDGTNTLFFEKLNWTGMLVEACPEAYLQMIENRSEKNNVFVNGIISCDNPFTLQKFISFGKRACSPTATAVEDPGYHSYWLSKRKGVFHTHYVMNIPLQPVLDTHKLTTIDFFSLDVEGAELNVLKSINFQRTKISVLLVEASKFFIVKNTKVRCLLEHLGYSGTNDGFINDIFWLKPMLPENLKSENMCHGTVRNGLNWCSEQKSNPYCKDLGNLPSKLIKEEVVAEYCQNHMC